MEWAQRLLPEAPQSAPGKGYSKMNRTWACFNTLMWTWLFYLLTYNVTDFASICGGMSLKLPRISELVLLLGSPFRQKALDPATVMLNCSVLAIGLNLKSLGHPRASRLQLGQTIVLALLFAVVASGLIAPFYRTPGNLG